MKFLRLIFLSFLLTNNLSLRKSNVVNNAYSYIVYNQNNGEEGQTEKY